MTTGALSIKGRIELQQRLRPERSGFKVRIDLGVNPGIGDFDEATRIARVVSNQPIPQLKNVHGAPSMRGFRRFTKCFARLVVRFELMVRLPHFLPRSH